MIHYTKGNLLNSKAHALVNTVNTMGVMGKGIALQFKEAYPENFRLYRDACKEGKLQVGNLLIVKELDIQGERVIINFPTKTKWWLKSDYSYIESGLQALVRAITENGLRSVAIPPLGCGLGGLKWEKVRLMIERYLGDVDADIYVYEPQTNIKARLQAEQQPIAAKLTPARAMLLYALYEYEQMGEPASLFVANKLAYFLQRMGEPLRLNFKAHHYGPYSIQIRHVLYALNGVYLKGLEQKDAKPFEPLMLNYDMLEQVNTYINQELTVEQHERLKRLSTFIDGFQSAFSLELLASIDFVMQSEPSLPAAEVQERLRGWSVRKADLFKPAYIQVAYEHLEHYRNGLSIKGMG
jgi:O-acetyl-ADP-ribose deacetylase (regulator of RNase III)